MSRTPRTETIVLAAGETQTVPIPGRVVAVRSCTVATFEAAFDQDVMTTFHAGGVYPSRDPFESIRVHDSLGGGCTIVLTIGDDPALDLSMSGFGPVLAAMAASLVSIDASAAAAAPGHTATLIPLTLVPVLPAAALQIVTAAAANNQCMIQADLDNAGNVYLGFTNAVDAANSFARLSPGESVAIPHDVDVWVVCDAGVNNVRGYAIA